MRSKTATLILLAFACWTWTGSSKQAMARITGFNVQRANWTVSFAAVPLDLACDAIAAHLNVPVFLERDVQASVSYEADGVPLETALRQMLKPHGLHAHFDAMGIHITREPIPYNVTHLAGDLALALAIPNGRTQQYHDDFSARWTQGDSTITARWEKVGQSPLASVVEEKLESSRAIYKFTHQPTSLKRNGKSYLAIQLRIPPNMTFNRQARKREEREMVRDLIYFKHGEYLYTVSHMYPREAAKAGAQISKRLIDTIRWEQTSEFQRFGRVR